MIARCTQIQETHSDLGGPYFVVKFEAVGGTADAFLQLNIRGDRPRYLVGEKYDVLVEDA